MSSDIVRDYLDSFSTPKASETKGKRTRVKCCGSSRCFYCTECYKLLVPEEECPIGMRSLPFNLHIILHDRRCVASGLHAKVLSERFCSKGATDKNDCSKRVQVFDLERLDPLPECFPENTYVLFPSDDSIPLQTVRHQVNTLVVMDCKWTKPSSRHDPRLASLPRVHLTSPPTASHYWRWHSAGQECLSTIEAIYEAACEVEPECNWLPWLWLFALQRAATGGMTEEQKLIQRELRRTRGTAKHLQDKERGRALSEQHKRERGEVRKQARKPQWQVHFESERGASLSASQRDIS